MSAVGPQALVPFKPPALPVAGGEWTAPMPRYSESRPASLPGSQPPDLRNSDPAGRARSSPKTAYDRRDGLYAEGGSPLVIEYRDD